MITRYNELNIAAGNKPEHGGYYLIRSHNMRRFLNSTLLAQPCNASIFFVDFIEGHEMDSTRTAYYRADPEILKAEYKKYIPSLTIAEEYDPERDPVFQNIKQLSEAQARVIANSSQETQKNKDRITELEAEMERMKKITSELQEKRNKLPELLNLIMNSEEGRKLYSEMQNGMK